MAVRTLITGSVRRRLPTRRCYRTNETTRWLQKWSAVFLHSAQDEQGRLEWEGWRAQRVAGTACRPPRRFVQGYASRVDTGGVGSGVDTGGLSAGNVAKYSMSSR